MADVITRFKLETTQYDSKLRDASKGLAEFAKRASLAGKDFDKFTKGNAEAARALGSIGTSANNTKDKVRELVGAYNDLARVYNVLTQEQQQSDWARAMAQSLQQLQARIKDAKQEMYGLNDAAKGMKGSASGGSDMSGMMAVFGGNLMARGAEVGISYMKDFGRAMYDTVQQAVELSRNAEGIRTAFERLNRPGLLDNLREATHGTVSDLELMKQAVKFNDFNLDVEQLGAFLAFAQQKAKDTGESVDYLVNSIVTGLGRKSLMILDNLGLSAAEIKEKMAETGDMTTAVAEIIKERMGEAGDYIETAFDRGARSEAELENATLKLGDAFRQSFGYEGFGEVGNVIETRLLNDFTQLIQSVDILTSKLSSMGIEGNRALTALSDLAFGLMAGPLGYFMALTGNSFKNYAVNNGTGATGGHIIKRNNPGGGGGGGTITPRGGRNTKIEEIVPVGSIKDLTNQLQALQKEQQLVTDAEGWQKYQQQIDDLTKRIDQLKGKVDEVDFDKLFPFKSIANGSTMSIGESMAASITQDLAIGMQQADVTALRSIMQVVIANGLEGIDIPTESLMEQIFGDGADIPDDVWQKFIDQINEKLKEKGIDPIQLDFSTGKTGKKKEEKEEKKYLSEGLSKLGGGLGGLQSGFEQLGIDLGDGFKDVVNGIQGVSTILSAIMTIVSAIEVIAGTDALIPFANGGVVHAANGWSGVVPGTSFSGDNVPILANSGEIVLNASQQSNLAQNLQGSGGGGVHVAGILRGEDIVLIADRWGRRTGKGELLFGKNL